MQADVEQDLKGSHHTLEARQDVLGHPRTFRELCEKPESQLDVQASVSWRALQDLLIPFSATGSQPWCLQRNTDMQTPEYRCLTF